MLFRNLATLRTDIPVFGSVDELERSRSDAGVPDDQGARSTSRRCRTDSSMKNPTRREMLELRLRPRRWHTQAARMRAGRGARQHAAIFPGFSAKRVKTSGARSICSRRIPSATPPDARRAADPRVDAPRRAGARKGLHRRRARPARLRRQRQAARRRGPREYSKRAMALDQVEVMEGFGFDKFAVVGHDRGGRVGHRMALIIPTRSRTGRARHRADVLPLHARRHPLHPDRVLPLVRRRAHRRADDLEARCEAPEEHAPPTGSSPRIPAHVGDPRTSARYQAVAPSAFNRSSDANTTTNLWKKKS